MRAEIDRADTPTGRTVAELVRRADVRGMPFTMADKPQGKRVAVDGQEVSGLSLMPEGLHATLKPEEFSDLIACLQSLKEAPAAAGATAAPAGNGLVG